MKEMRSCREEERFGELGEETGRGCQGLLCQMKELLKLVSKPMSCLSVSRYV